MEFEKEMPENNIFTFNTDESKHREIFRIEPSGEIYINSKLVGKDTNVVKALRQVLEPEIKKNNLYDEMLEMLQVGLDLFEGNTPGMKDIQQNYLDKVSELIKKAKKQREL